MGATEILSTMVQNNAEPRGAELCLGGITKMYGDTAAVRDLHLTVAAGEFVTLLGASGSGKTTALMILAGFTTPTCGRVTIGGHDVTSWAPGKRNLGVVFQNYSLFPHLTVAQNLAFPLEMRRESRGRIEEKVRQALDMVQLSDMGERYPRELSGGQQQRIALARAIIFQPQALLMDEPLGALDKNLREHMQVEIKRLHASLGATIVFVTHDQEEALTISDRIAVMQDGAIAQIAPAGEIYKRPVNKWVAGFIGQSNFLHGVAERRDGDDIVVRLGSGELIRARGVVEGSPGQKVCGVLRPEHIRVELLNGDGPSLVAGSALAGKVEETLYLGHTLKMNIRLTDGSVLMTQVGSGDYPRIPARGADVLVAWDPGNVWLVHDEEGNP